MVFIFISCASIPKYFEDPYSFPHVRCSANEHLTSVGISSEPNESLSQAKVGISKQIASSIQSDSEIYSVVQIKKEEQQLSSSVDKKIEQLTQESTSFKYSNLIEEIEGPKKYGENYYSLVCLSKEKSSRFIVEKNIEHQKKMDDTIVQFDNATDYLVKSNLYHSLKEPFEILLQEYLLAYYIDKSFNKTLAGFVNSFKEMESHLQKERTKLSISYVISAEDHTSHWSSVIESTFSQSSLKVIGDKDCQSVDYIFTFTF